MSSTAILTSKGQITIPKLVRDALGLSTGDRVTFRLREDGSAELTPEVDILSLQGSVRPGQQRFSVEDMNEAVKTRAASQFLATGDRKDKA